MKKLLFLSLALISTVQATPCDEQWKRSWLNACKNENPGVNGYNDCVTALNNICSPNPYVFYEPNNSPSSPGYVEY